MAINKKLIHFDALTSFQGANGINTSSMESMDESTFNGATRNVPFRSIVFIKDQNLIWTHGTYYKGTDTILNGNYVTLDTEQTIVANKIFSASVNIDTLTSGNLTVGGLSTFSNSAYFTGAGGFIYSGMQSSDENASTPVWFSQNGITGRPVYDNDFRYNPSTNTLTVGTINITGTKPWNSDLSNYLTKPSGNKTIWGQTYLNTDGEFQNVTGDLTISGSTSPTIIFDRGNTNIDWKLYANGNGYFYFDCNTTGNQSTFATKVKFTNNGDIYAHKFIKNSDSTNILLANGNDISQSTFLTSAALDGYLPLTGGTMNQNGYIAFNSYSNENLTNLANNTFAIAQNIIQGKGNIFIEANTNDTGTEYVFITSGYSLSTTTNDLLASGLAIGKTTLTWKNNNILHSGYLGTAPSETDKEYSVYQKNNKLYVRVPWNNGVKKAFINPGDTRSMDEPWFRIATFAKPESNSQTTLLYITTTWTHYQALVEVVQHASGNYFIHTLKLLRGNLPLENLRLYYGDVNSNSMELWIKVTKSDTTQKSVHTQVLCENKRSQTESDYVTLDTELVTTFTYQNYEPCQFETFTQSSIGANNNPVYFNNSGQPVASSYSFTTAIPANNSDDTTIPTSKAVWDAIDRGFDVNNALVFIGTYSGQTTSSTVKTGTGTFTPAFVNNDVKKGWMWIVSDINSGEYFGNIRVEVGDLIIAADDEPGTTISKYYLIQKNIDPTIYVTLTTEQTITGQKTFNSTNTIFNKNVQLNGQTDIASAQVGNLQVSGLTSFAQVAYGCTPDSSAENNELVTAEWIKNKIQNIGTVTVSGEKTIWGATYVDSNKVLQNVDGSLTIPNGQYLYTGSISTTGKGIVFYEGNSNFFGAWGEFSSSLNIPTYIRSTGSDNLYHRYRNSSGTTQDKIIIDENNLGGTFNESKRYPINFDTTSKKLYVDVSWTDNNSATATDAILDGSNDGTAIKYEPYSAATAIQSWVNNNSNAGKLYFGEQNPSKTTRLNYNGYFYASKLYSNGYETITTNTISNYTSNYLTKPSTDKKVWGQTYIDSNGNFKDVTGDITLVASGTSNTPRIVYQRGTDADANYDFYAGVNYDSTPYYTIGATRVSSGVQQNPIYLQLTTTVGTAYLGEGINKILTSGNSSISGNTITINGTSLTVLTEHQSLSNYLTDVGLATGKSTSGNTDKSLTNGNVYLKLFKNSSEDSKIKISGTSPISVTTDTNGDIAISANLSSYALASDIPTAGVGLEHKDGAFNVLKDFYTLSTINNTPLSEKYNGNQWNIDTLITPGSYTTLGGNGGSTQKDYVVAGTTSFPTFSGGFRIYVQQLDTSNTGYYKQTLYSYSGKQYYRIGSYNGTTATWGNWSEILDSNNYSSIIGLGNYLPLAGGIMSGSIKRYYNENSDDPMIALTSNNKDVWLWRINSGSSAGVAISQAAGFGLKYIGSGTGVNNNLVLYADNLGSNSEYGTQVAAVTINQSGAITISNSSYGPLTIKRTNTNYAGIRFENSNGALGSISMSDVNGPLVRWNAAATTSYTIFDTENAKWANLSVSTSTNTKTIPMFGEIQITNSTAGSGDTHYCRQVYDATNQCLKFIFV